MHKKALTLIQKFDTIIIHRHKNPDGDAIGSQVGLAETLKATFPEKHIFIAGDGAGRFAFMENSTPDYIPDETYDGALAIVLDCGASFLISDDRYKRAAATLRFDHHLKCEDICDVDIVDSSYESCCGLLADFLIKNKLTLTDLAAKSLFTGMVTDSGRFRYESTTGETLRLAGMLLDYGIDTDRLFANLYLEDFDYFKYEAYIHKKMSITPAGVAHIHVTNAMQQQFNLSTEQASEAVSFLNSIKGSIVWIAFIDMPDGTIRVRLRSRFIEINTLAEKYRGGGHQCTCGATLYNKREIKALLADADKMVAEYKNTHEGWL